MIADSAMLELGPEPRALEAGGAWQVRSPVMLWAAPRENIDEPVAVGAIAAGDMVFGGGFSGDDGTRYTLLASSETLTLLEPLDVGALSPTSRDDVLQHYVRFVLSAMGVAEVHPDRVLEREEITLATGETAGARRRVAFARVSAGSALYNGLVTVTRGTVVPLTAGTWVRALGPCTLGPVGRSDDVSVGDRMGAIDLVNALLGALWVERERTKEAARFERLREGAAHERGLLGRGLRELGGVLDRDSLTIEPSSDPVFAAAALVAAATGVMLHETITRRTGLARLQAIGDASHVAVRMVALTPDWWKREIAPFVAFRGDDDEPVAVLATPGGGYAIVDPRTGSRERVDAGAAKSLPAEVHTLLRPFPDRALGVRDLAAFALRGSRVDVLGTLGLGFLGALLATTIPLTIALLFDSVVPSAQRGQLGLITLALAFFAVVAAGTEFVRGMFIVRAQSRFTTSLQTALMERLISLPASFFRKFGVGDLAQRVVGVDQIEQYISDITISSALGGMFSLVSLVLIFAYDRPLALVSVGLAIVAVAVQVLEARYAVYFAGKIAQLSGPLASDVLQMIDGVAKLRVANAEIRGFARWLEKFTGQRRVIVAAANTANAFVTFAQVWPMFAGFALIAWVVFGQTSKIDVGAFLAASAAMGQFVAGILGLGSAAATAAKAVPIYRRARPFLDVVPERQDVRRDPGQLSGAVSLSDVSFRYTPTGRPALDGISLDIAPGEFVAVVGPSGSGKSTLLRLLLGFEDPAEGSVSYDGRDLRVLDVGAVRRQIGTVLQSTRLMPGSIFENIAAGRIITLDEAWDAARAVGLAGDIAAMPMHMQTFVDSSGGAFSGGQRQRIAIARAIATVPRLLFFDEATSALDNATQAVVSATLRELRVTRIVIAHRLSTIVDADRIVVVEAGRIVQSGGYAELLVQPGPFAELAKRQMI